MPSARTTPTFWRALENWSCVTLPLFYMSKNLKVFCRKVPSSCVAGHFCANFVFKSFSKLLTHGAGEQVLRWSEVSRLDLHLELGLELTIHLF